VSFKRFADSKDARMIFDDVGKKFKIVKVEDENLSFPSPSLNILLVDHNQDKQKYYPILSYCLKKNV